MASALPAGWTEFKDPTSGNPYFNNAGTGETTWTRPVAVDGMSVATPAPVAQTPVTAMDASAAAVAQASSPLPEGWAEFFDASSSKHYYHRAATGETTWTRPVEMSPAPAQMAMGGVMQFGGMPQIGMPQGAPMGMPQMGMPQMGMPQMGMPQMGMPQMGMPQLGMPQGSPMGMPVTAATKVTGHVKIWNEEKGFGFIIPEDGGADVFVHRTSLSDGNMLEKGAPVLYELSWSEPKKKYAAMGVMGAVSNPSSQFGGGGIPGMPGMPVLGGGGGGPPNGGQPSDNLFVAGLPLDMTDDKLRTVFAGYGNVVDCRVLPDSAKSDRAALVRMADVAMASFMVNNLHGTVPAGHGLTMPLTIRFAESKNKGQGKGAPALDVRSQPYGGSPAPFPVGPLGDVPTGQAMALPS